MTLLLVGIVIGVVVGFRIGRWRAERGAARYAGRRAMAGRADYRKK